MKKVSKRGIRGVAEGDGWVNWSGVATLLANVEKTLAAKLERIFSQSELHRPH
jgi:hypothetical protein